VGASSGQDAFYLPIVRIQISQGDIALAPTSLLRSQRAVGVHVGVARQPRLGRSSTGVLWSGNPPYSDPIYHTSRWSPVIVVSHDCTIDKDFNEVFSALMKSGLSVEEARDRAGNDPKLDEFIQVAPVISLAELPPAKQQGIAQRMGYFALEPSIELGASTMVADLLQISTIDWRLLGKRRLSLSDRNVGVLRYKLVELFAYRTTTIDKIEELVGKRLVSVSNESRKRGTVRATLHFEDRHTCTVELRDVPQIIPGLRDVSRPPNLRSGLDLRDPSTTGPHQPPWYSRLKRFLSRWRPFT
jgi:hypothetical protein